MPYTSVSELPRKQTSDLSPKQRRQFREVFNSQIKRGLSERRAFASAHSVARRGKKKKLERKGSKHA